jgi:hypothetical protein
MKWKRGLLLAGVNLIAAAAMIALLESRDARYVNENESNRLPGARSKVVWRTGLDGLRPPRLVAAQEEQTINFPPCGGLVHYPVQVEVVRLGNMPASELVGWRLDCRPRWTLSGRILGEVEKVPTKRELPLQRRVDLGLGALIVIQWLLVGGLPLTKHQQFWSEPGAFITICTLIATALASIHAIEDLARLPALLACLAWFWWFALLIWRGICFAWRSLMRLRKTGVSV